ncbi:MAG: DinB family protein, partial [Pyrinomonadaceae bacterium]
VRNGPDEFSALENICHLRDIETEGYEVRIVRMLEESNPSLRDIDGSRLAIERDYNNQDPQSALQDFADARHRNIQRLKNLSLEQLELEGTLEGVGRVTLGRLIEMMSEHDEGHLLELNIIQRRHRGAAAT